MNKQFIKKISKDEVICRNGDLSFDLYKVISGKLMICTRNNSMVTPLAYIKPGEYFGEMSFFDKFTRSADVIAIEESTLQQIPEGELKKQFPIWLIICAKSLTKKLRFLNEVVAKKGIKKKSTGTVEPLSIEEQRYYYNLLK
ncbi:MAG: cyclic nucleotide-binding domain-containing protein [Bacteriovoracaceae bacterium]|jgi:CRP-like cAMP-binding protein|nr:cyclic nucleotide-binding domain-containing protein [Bacteriovoracaceae bacterium]